MDSIEKGKLYDKIERRMERRLKKMLVPRGDVRKMLGFNGEHFYLYQEEPGEELTATGSTISRLFKNYTRGQNKTER